MDERSAKTNTDALMEVFNRAVDHERQTLFGKTVEYGMPQKRLWNFYRGAQVIGTTPTLCLWGYLGKHLTSISDICHGKKASPEMVREKIGDARNYLVLLEALLLEGERNVE